MRLIIAAERIALSAAEAPELTAERIAAEASETAVAVIRAAAAAVSVTAVGLLRLTFALPLIHDHAVSLLDLFEFFFQFFLVRLSDIGVRMVLPTEHTICFFDFFFCRIVTDAQYFIGIHLLFPPLLSVQTPDLCLLPFCCLFSRILTLRPARISFCRNVPRHRNIKCF